MMTKPYFKMLITALSVIVIIRVCRINHKLFIDRLIPFVYTVSNEWELCKMD